MSFVSVIATKEYISVMTDGLAQDYDGKTVEENYVKYRMINDNKIVAATGDSEVIEDFYKESLVMHNCGFTLKQMAIKLQELMIEYIKYNEDDPISGWNIHMVVGGIAEDGELEFYGLSNSYKKLEELQMYEFRDENDGDYALFYLVSPYAPNGDELTEALHSIIKKNTNTFLVSSGEQIVPSQKELHKYVAGIDRTVNDITFSKVINKRQSL
ncbi:hypothetical protein [Bacillus toyonensis]|uniref:hypothetical protein n=1 Tax=Bacillus toyonensis TaxID=155322 RepID=UPI002E207D5F|nr:hypothetical protein [Bacillus toyonensis]